MDQRIGPSDYVTPVVAANGSESASNNNNPQWHMFGRKIPKSEIVYFVQVILIYIVVITSIVNLTINKDEGKLWTALLSSSFGYLLPNPNLKHRDR